MPQPAAVPVLTLVLVTLEELELAAVVVPALEDALVLDWLDVPPVPVPVPVPATVVAPDPAPPEDPPPLPTTLLLAHPNAVRTIARAATP